MSFIQFIAITFFSWNLFGLIVLINWEGESRLGFSHILTPTGLYKHYKVNYFGCFWLTLIANLLCPLFTISFWFYKLCIVGRKD